MLAAERELDALTAEVKRNDDKLRRSQNRELQLLQAPSLDALFFEMIDGLEESYGLEYVGVTLHDPSHDIRHLLLSNSFGVHARLQLVDTLTGLAPQYVALRKPWLGAYAACDHQLVFGGAERLRSVAMIPLWQRQELVGSINLGSSDPARFTRHHASDFLAHLGVIASFAIENAVNRARLRRSGFTDVLTGWHNRRYLQARLKEELARAKRDQNNLMCLMLDIDHFKRINDTWGMRPVTRCFASSPTGSNRRFARAISRSATAVRNSSYCCPIWRRNAARGSPSAFARPSQRRHSCCRAGIQAL